jgi:hypothetical protein
MMNNHRTLFYALLCPMLLFISVLSVSGRTSQSICVISERKLPLASGVIQFPDKTPVVDATVELREKNDRGRVVAQLKTNEKGRFSFANVPNGKYVIIASSLRMVTLYVPVRIVSSSKRDKKQHELVITLNGLIGEPCGGGAVELRECEVK